MVHNDCSASIEADLGNKAEYAFGNAKGSPHNIQRSKANAIQLRKIGIHDNDIGRKLFYDHFKNTFNINKKLIMGNSGRTMINSLLVGPGGFIGVQSLWEGNKLITFIFFGG